MYALARDPTSIVPAFSESGGTGGSPASFEVAFFQPIRPSLHHGGERRRHMIVRHASLSKDHWILRLGAIDRVSQAASDISNIQTPWGPREILRFGTWH